MSDQKNDGGPAFPCDSTNKQCPTQCGMSLRAWLAGQAMKGIVSATLSSGRIHFSTLGSVVGHSDRLEIAQAAIALADDLISQLGE